MTDYVLPEKPKPSRNRSRRLRKKLYLDEFQWLGFEIKVELSRDQYVFLDTMIEYIEAKKWQLGGGTRDGLFDGYICGPANKLTEQGVDEFIRWLQKTEFPR